jgi:hypothetical protein
VQHEVDGTVGVDRRDVARERGQLGVGRTACRRSPDVGLRRGVADVGVVGEEAVDPQPDELADLGLEGALGRFSPFRVSVRTSGSSSGSPIERK